MQSKNFENPTTDGRQGAMIILIGALLIVLLGMVVMSVDTAYMQLARTELRTATDAAAKAAAGELTKTNGNDVSARAEGIRIAGLNKVAGRPLVLRNQDFEFGQAVQQSDGSWTFNAGMTPFTSVRVTGLKSQTAPSGPVNLMFGSVFGSGLFTPKETAVASQFDQEIVLAVDRSHSMAFDLSGVSWRYPYTTGTAIDHLIWKPHNSGSRWAVLKSAVDLYLSTASHVSRPPRVSLVTWGSYIGPGSYETFLTGLIVPAVQTDALLTSNYSEISNAISTLGNKSMFGGTNMAAGIDQARSILNSSATRPMAKKVIVLLTDGEWNAGRDPVAAARDAAAEGITIHSVGFLSQGIGVLQQIADATGGRRLAAANKAELEAVFRELALSLPIALTE